MFNHPTTNLNKKIKEDFNEIFALSNEKKDKFPKKHIYPEKFNLPFENTYNYNCFFDERKIFFHTFSNIQSNFVAHKEKFIISVMPIDLTHDLHINFIQILTHINEILL